MIVSIAVLLVRSGRAALACAARTGWCGICCGCALAGLAETGVPNRSEPDSLAFERTSVRVEVGDSPEEAVLVTFSCLLRNPRRPDSEGAHWWEKQPSFQLHHSVQLKRVTSRDGPVRWNLGVTTPHRRVAQRFVNVDLGTRLKPGETRELVFEYAIQLSNDDAGVLISPRGGYLRSMSGFSPRLSFGDNDLPCVREVHLKWRGRVESGILAAPGGLTRLEAHTDGYLHGVVRATRNEKGLNDVVWAGGVTEVEGTGVRVFGQSRSLASYLECSAWLEESRALMEEWIGPLSEPVVAIEIESEHGGCISPGVVLFPTGMVEAPRSRQILLLAHELSHSYFGQDVYVIGRGGAVLTEGLAEYFALLTLESLEGEQAVRDYQREMRLIGEQLVESPVTLSHYSSRHEFPAAQYGRAASFWMTIEQNIGREPLLTWASRLWKEYKGTVVTVEAALLENRELQNEWKEQGSRPGWEEFLRTWLQTNELPPMGVDRG